ncbi:12253_t:CDS:10 [Funneliformis caledonium]|uniref:SWR1-complex protein 4 n=1 Tax=Funneliformis caledonium TaxID=1117310 RepID=A0A9N9FBW6_9GLOM|nr:12253_t:CDS:10 [Funneliformis caledonium]
MSDTENILKDIRTSLAILPEIKTLLEKLTEAVKALQLVHGHDTIDVPAAAQLVNGISDSFVSQIVFPIVDSIESEGGINDINDMRNHPLNNEEENDQNESKVENLLSSAELTDKPKKKFSLSEKKKLRRMKRKRSNTKLSPEGSSSIDLNLRSTSEIQSPRPSKEVALSRVPARPPPRFQLNRTDTAVSPKNDGRDRLEMRGKSNQSTGYQREMLKDNWQQLASTFEEMNLKSEILLGIHALGSYNQPTSIQQRAIMAILSRRDAVIQIPRLEERTITYIAALLQQIETSDKSCQAIIIVHSKDLCLAIQDLIDVVGQHMRFSCLVCIGGIPVRQDVENLRNEGHQIIVGTPGRLIGLMTDRKFDFQRIKTIIVEDSCIMFNSNFRSQAFDIIYKIPKSAQKVLMTTATTFTLADIKNKITNNTIIVLDDVNMSDELRLYYTVVEKDDQKLNALCEIYKDVDIQKSVIFCDNSERVDWLSDKLTTLFENMTVYAMHSSTKQSDRHEIVKSFWKSEVAVIVTTDCFSSVLAFHPVDYSVHFDLPYKKEEYHDRLCCCGAYGPPGVVINILIREQLYDLGVLERYYRLKSKELKSQELPISVDLTMSNKNISDVREILGVETSSILDKVNSDKKINTPVSRELSALVGHHVSVAFERATALKAKPNLHKAVGKWTWNKYINPARNDDLMLSHWTKENTEEETISFADFNKKVEIEEYTDEEYEKYLKDRDWSREETDYLFDLCRKYDIRWTVIHDRYDWKDKDRTMEDLRDRYYSVIKKILQVRPITPGSQTDKGQQIALNSYDKVKEEKRKNMLLLLYSRTKEQIEEEEALQEISDRIQANEKKFIREREALMKQFTVEALQPKRKKSLLSGPTTPTIEASGSGFHNTSDLPKKNRRTSASSVGSIAIEAHSPKEVHTPMVVKKEKLTPGVLVRSQKIPIPKLALLHKVHKSLQEFGLGPRPTMPTETVCAKFTELQKMTQNLLDLKKLVDKQEHDLKVKRTTLQKVLSASGGEKAGNIAQEGASTDGYIDSSTIPTKRDRGSLPATPRDVKRARK